MYMLMLLEIAIIGGVNLRPNFSPSVEINYKVWWAKRRRKIVRRDNGKVVEFEEVRYGM